MCTPTCCTWYRTSSSKSQLSGIIWLPCCVHDCEQLQFAKFEVYLIQFPTISHNFRFRRKPNMIIAITRAVRLNAGKNKHFSTYLRRKSTTSTEDEDGPSGNLFRADTDVGQNLVGKSAWIYRTFYPPDHYQILLTRGEEALAKDSSFDPDYKRARDWIRNHHVGPIVLCPDLTNGLVGALVEAMLLFYNLFQSPVA